MLPKSDLTILVRSIDGVAVEDFLALLDVADGSNDLKISHAGPESVVVAGVIDERGGSEECDGTS